MGKKNIIIILLIAITLMILAIFLVTNLSIKKDNEDNKGNNDSDILFLSINYGGFTTKEIANTVNGKYINSNGEIYEYQIPCDDEGELTVEINNIDSDIVKKYKTTLINKISENDLKEIKTNIKNITETYNENNVNKLDAGSSMYYIIRNNKRILIKEDDSLKEKENNSEAGKKIIEILKNNNILNY